MPRSIRNAFILVGILLANSSFGQILTGSVADSTGPLQGVNVVILENGRGDVTDSGGVYELDVPPGQWTIQFSFVGYVTETRSVTFSDDALLEAINVSVIMRTDQKVLDQVQVLGEMERDEAGLYMIEPKAANLLPTAFPDITRVLASLPGVFSNNELSSSYSVRGGNYDENLIYIDDVPIYRPQLVKAGRQEGLNLINPDLVDYVAFSAGGWQPRYGDKLASALTSGYDFNDDFSASAMVSMMMVSASAKGGNKSGNLHYFGGFRHRNLRYLLNTFEVEGDYFPKYTDFQGGFEWKLNDKTSLTLFGIYSKNRYLVEPSTQETDFGTFFSTLRFLVAFEGQEQLGFDTYQGALKLSHQMSEKHTLNFITSYVDSRERDYVDLEGGYRLCDIDNDPNSSTFNQCATIRGIGTNYHYARNALDTRILTAEMRNRVELNNANVIEYGIGYEQDMFDDKLDEYRFIDSAKFVSITEVIKSENNTSASIGTAYVQHRVSFGEGMHTLNYGVRFNYRDLNKQLLVSPRVSYSLRPEWVRNTSFRFSAGLYGQQPFYKEMRDFDGTLNTSQRPQLAWHFIGAIDHKFSMWGRPFVLVTEAYYRLLTSIIPYDMDNVRIRYYATETGSAYAYGLDTRISGEFIPGLESWFSLGLLNTKEDIDGDGRGYLDRPTNQNVNMAIVFQDHLPNSPTFRVSLSLLYGSGLPFGPTNDLTNRNSFKGESYNRVDVGFSKQFLTKEGSALKDLSLGLDILNLFGSNNVISYNFIQDVNGTSFAVPNRLSQRFLNVWLRVNF